MGYGVKIFGRGLFRTSPDHLEANEETFRFVNYFVRVFPKQKAANSSIFEELYEHEHGGRAQGPWNQGSKGVEGALVLLLHGFHLFGSATEHST